ncbi:MAG: GntR family transcriptional regulator [Devosia sp.]|uniref:GntR family transcriptional regulator n=1 Tax=Devosia sp. 66-22 TaxID=1895753 RepID=UPI0009258EBD|nr:GntR family transcriptional regulator [Devosia sp. 66-22]MBN9348385.1 GntR family transcriptional regulator [Devosia sp.]OJX47647.1 MAG: GntR family transcriptional regulator [Devosia sp. 66-22]
MANTPEPKAFSDLPVPRVRGSGVQTVYDALKQSIVELTLEPGAPLDEVTLAERFDMSRTPVREALVRLAAEGLVTQLPNRNTIVAPIDFGQLPVYFEALTLMYRVTTRLAANGRTERHLAAMRRYQALYAEAVRADDVPGMIGHNRDFHVAIAEAGGNPYFTGLFTRLLDEGRRILRLYYYKSFNDHLPRKYVKEHDALVDAIEARDAELCEKLAAAHAGQIVKQIQSYIAKDRTREMAL